MSMSTCAYCKSLILSGEPAMSPLDLPMTLHLECAIRTVVGGVPYLLGVGLLDDDHPGLSRRDAAVAACSLWRQRRGLNHGPVTRAIVDAAVTENIARIMPGLAPKSRGDA